MPAWVLKPEHHFSEGNWRGFCLILRLTVRGVKNSIKGVATWYFKNGKARYALNVMKANPAVSVPSGVLNIIQNSILNHDCTPTSKNLRKYKVSWAVDFNYDLSRQSKEWKDFSTWCFVRDSRPWLAALAEIMMLEDLITICMFGHQLWRMV